MLAREIKIANLKHQRDFITKQLEHLISHPAINGNSCYRYVGDIFPEVIDHFTNEGFCVERIHSDLLTADTEGLPVYLFTVSHKVILSQEELKFAEEF